MKTIHMSLHLIRNISVAILKVYFESITVCILLKSVFIRSWFLLVTIKFFFSSSVIHVIITINIHISTIKGKKGASVAMAQT